MQLAGSARATEAALGSEAGRSLNERNEYIYIYIYIYIYMVIYIFIYLFIFIFIFIFIIDIYT